MRPCIICQHPCPKVLTSRGPAHVCQWCLEQLEPLTVREPEVRDAFNHSFEQFMRERGTEYGIQRHRRWIEGSN
jgi:hypothetical protein